MSLLSEILSPIRRSLPSYSSTLYQPAPWLSEALGAIPSESGVSVNERTAVTLSAVWSCVTIISSAIASLPLETYRRDDKGVRQKADDARIYGLLHDEPNSEDTSYTFWEKLLGSLLLYGNGYAELQEDGAGRIYALWPWPASMVQIALGQNRGDYQYIIRDRKIPKENMLHLRGFTYEGIIGLSPIQNMKRCLGLSVATEIFASHFYKNGAKSSGVLMYPGRLGEKGKTNLAESVQRHNEGLANAHKIMVLEEGAKYQPLTIPQDDAQFLETRKFSRAEIAGIYRVPAMLIPGADEKAATYASAEQMMRVFVDFCLRGWMENIEQELERRVLPPGMECEFDTTEFMRADAAARASYYRSLWEIGVVNAGQIASLEGFTPPDNGDTYYVPSNNFSPVHKIEAIIDSKIQATKQAASGGGAPAGDKGNGGGGDGTLQNPRVTNPRLPSRMITKGMKGLLASSLREIQGWEFFKEARAAAKLKPILRAMADEEVAAEPVIEAVADRLASRVRSLSPDGQVDAEVEAVAQEIQKLLLQEN